MNTTQIVKVFLGSSITELKDERVDISSIITEEITNLFERDDISVQFKRCETLNEGNTGEDDQLKIDRIIGECDLCLFLFKNKVGEQTRHEFDVAREVQKKRRSQKKKQLKLFIAFLKASTEVNTREDLQNAQGLFNFQEYLNKENIYWGKYESISEVRHALFCGILKHLGVTISDGTPETEAAEKSGDELFEQLETTKEKMHKAIDDLLAQIPSVMSDENQLVSARIYTTFELYKKADLWAGKSGYDKTKYCQMLFYYGGFLYDYGMYRDAEEVYLRQIALSEELYGPDHPDTATSYNNIGSVYWKMGDYPRALECYNKALAIYEKKLVPDNSDTATSYNNIGTVYDDMGDYPHALEYYNKALAIVEKVLGSDHPYTASTYNNIGLVYSKKGDCPHALEYYKKDLAISEKVLGPDHPDTATSYHNIGTLYYQMKEYGKALEYLEKALAIRKAELGDEHPYTKGTMKWIAATKEAMGKAQ